MSGDIEEIVRRYRREAETMHLNNLEERDIEGDEFEDALNECSLPFCWLSVMTLCNICGRNIHKGLVIDGHFQVCSRECGRDYLKRELARRLAQAETDRIEKSLRSWEGA